MRSTDVPAEEPQAAHALQPPQRQAEEPPPAESNPHIIPLFRAQPTLIESASQLAAAGADALKAELERLGLKCGGTTEMRAERLFSTRGKPQSEWPRGIFAKRKASGQQQQRDAKRPQRGPTLPGQSRAPGAVRVPGAAEQRRAAARPLGRPQGQGAGAVEQVGVYRPNT